MATTVVTGAASGMGRACIERLRGLGDVVVAVDLERPDIDGTVGTVCFSSSAAYQVAPFVTPDHDALLADPLAPDFLDRAVDAVGGDSGFAYALAKVGVIRAAGRAAVRWGARGGRVCSVAPGLIDTPMGRQELAQQPMMRTMLEQTPLGRLGDPAEVADVAGFLLSDRAAYVSGIDVLVDGAMLQGTADGRV